MPSFVTLVVGKKILKILNMQNLVDYLFQMFKYQTVFLDDDTVSVLNNASLHQNNLEHSALASFFLHGITVRASGIWVCPGSV